MAKVRQILIGSILGIFSLGIAAQTVYSWQDAKGVVHFSQQPPAQGEYQLVTIRTNQAASRPAVSSTGAEGNAQAAASGFDATLCQQARDQLTLLQSGQELFTKEANSEELRLLTSEEREQQILLINFEIKRRCATAP